MNVDALSVRNTYGMIVLNLDIPKRAIPERLHSFAMPTQPDGRRLDVWRFTGSFECKDIDRFDLLSYAELLDRMSSELKAWRGIILSALETSQREEPQ